MISQVFGDPQQLPSAELAHQSAGGLEPRASPVCRVGVRSQRAPRSFSSSWGDERTDRMKQSNHREDGVGLTTRAVLKTDEHFIKFLI